MIEKTHAPRLLPSRKRSRDCSARSRVSCNRSSAAVRSCARNSARWCSARRSSTRSAMKVSGACALVFSGATEALSREPFSSDFHLPISLVSPKATVREGVQARCELVHSGPPAVLSSAASRGNHLGASGRSETALALLRAGRCGDRPDPGAGPRRSAIRPGKPSCRRATSPGDLFLVIDGRLRVSSCNANGDEVVLSIMGPGRRLRRDGAARRRAAFGHGLDPRRLPAAGDRGRVVPCAAASNADAGRRA